MSSYRNIILTLKISIKPTIKNLETLKFVHDCLKAKKMCKNALKKLPFVIRNIPDQYKGAYIKYVGRGGGPEGFTNFSKKNS